MKMKGAKAVHYESGPNMTPLVDVVMVILIFLMLAGSLVGSARFIMSKAGYNAQGVGGPPDKNKPQDADIVITIRPDPKGFYATVTGTEGTTDAAVLTQTVIEKRDRFLSIGTKEDAIQVVLAPRADLTFQACISAYAAASASKIQKVTWRAAN